MKDLGALQRAFQRALLAQDTELLPVIEPAPGLAPPSRLAIYQQAYRLRLEDALANNYPRLRQLVGEHAFATLAEGYVAAHPSRHASIRWVGEALESELSRSFPHQPWLAELARWEWGMTEAFDAADAASLTSEALSTFAPGDWPRLHFVLHPSIRKLRMSTNAPALFKALSEEQSPPEAQQTEHAVEWLIWRQALRTRYRSLEKSEAAALGSVLDGESFSSMCVALCGSHGTEQAPLRAAMLLRQWFDDALVCNVTIG